MEVPHLIGKLCLQTHPGGHIQGEGAAVASKITFESAVGAGRDSPAKGLLPALAGAFPSVGAFSDAGVGAGAAPRLALKILRFLIAVLSARAKPSPTCRTAYRFLRTYPDLMGVCSSY